MDTHLELGPGLAVFQGANGQGKSNLLEAAYLLAVARSPRTASDRELVNWVVASNGGHAQVLGVGREGDTTTQAQVDVDVAGPATAALAGADTLVKKSLRINGIVRSAAEFVGKLNVVYFEAGDLQLVHGGPAERRRFLDILISQTDPVYLKTLQRYSRVVMQRNQLLRRIREGLAAGNELEFWDERLALEGAAIVEKRAKVVASLTRDAVEQHGLLTEAREVLAVSYRPRLSAGGDDDLAADVVSAPLSRLAAAIGSALSSLRDRETAQGVTLAGPHRDELLVTLDGRPAAPFASRGQARSIALSLKLAEASLLRKATGRRPILALDDVLSELDITRRRHVLSQAMAYEQVMLTVTEFSLVDPGALGAAAKYSVMAGKVERI